MAREVRVAILGDSRDFSRAVNQANRDAGRLHGAFSKAGGGIASLAKGAAVGVGALAVGGAVVAKGFVDAAIESQKVTKQTEAVIKSMGGASKVSARQVADLSTKLSLKSGIDDELIQSGANVLLTFGKIRNEVGKGNDIFNRANQAALDMSVALGTDMKAASMQVGKALNDPIRGLTALRRSGIQFTKQQEDQIKAMVKAGDVAGAQKVMLKELERQFGGSAAAQATASDKLKVAWGNLQEQLGAKLLPVVEKFASFLASNLPGAMRAVERVVGPVIKTFSMFFNALRTGFTEDEGTGPERFALKLRETLSQVAAFIREWWPKVVAGFQAVVAWVEANWPKIQQIIGQVVTTVGSIVAGAVSVITTLWDNFGNNILSFVQRVWPRIQQIIEGALKVIRGIVQTVTSLIKGDWSGVWDGIKSIVNGAWQAIQGIVGAALEALRGVIGIGLEIVGSIFKGAWNGLVGWFWSIPGKVRDIATRIWESLKSGLTAAIRWIKQQIDKLLGPLDEIAGKVGGIVGKVGGVAKGIPGVGAVAGMLGFDSGGVVPGRRGQPRLVVAHAGETILPTHKTGTSTAGATYHITIQTAADPQAVVEAVSRYLKSNVKPSWAA